MKQLEFSLCQSLLSLSQSLSHTHLESPRPQYDMVCVVFGVKDARESFRFRMKEMARRRELRSKCIELHKVIFHEREVSIDIPWNDVAVVTYRTEESREVDPVRDLLLCEE